MSKIWGFRWDDKDYNVGDVLPASREYDESGLTGEILSGTSVIMVSGEKDFLDYLDKKIESDFGELDKYNEWIDRNDYCSSSPHMHLYLVYIDTAWDTWEYGNDESEIVMSNPEVVRKIR